jgi:putative endonuclease
MQTRRQYFVYLMTNKWNRVLYTGVTSDLRRRVEQHQSTLGGGFSAKYGVKKLVYYEVFDDPSSAIAREKQIKAGARKGKVELVVGMNPEWRDLVEDL